MTEIGLDPSVFRGIQPLSLRKIEVSLNPSIKDMLSIIDFQFSMNLDLINFHIDCHAVMMKASRFFMMPS